MHPALSIVFFTTASGAGFSLFLLLGLGGALDLLPSSSGFGLAALALAALLAAGGLASSALGRDWSAFAGSLPQPSRRRRSIALA